MQQTIDTTPGLYLNILRIISEKQILIFITSHCVCIGADGHKS